MATHSQTRYSRVTQTVHWLAAVLIGAQIALISLADATEDRSWVDLHKSIGLSLLVLTLLRLGWRAAEPLKPLPDGTPGWQRFLARATQILFYVALLALPLTGWLASSAGSRAISWFGLFDWPLLPIEGGRGAARAFIGYHRLLVKALYLLLGLHVLGALKHSLLDRDDVLARMAPGLRRWLR